MGKALETANTYGRVLDMIYKAQGGLLAIPENLQKEDWTQAYDRLNQAIELIEDLQHEAAMEHEFAEYKRLQEKRGGR